MSDQAPPNSLVGGQGPVSEVGEPSVYPQINHTGLNYNVYTDSDSQPIGRDQTSAYGAGHIYWYYRKGNNTVDIHMPYRYYDRENYEVCCRLKSFKKIDHPKSCTAKNPSKFHRSLMNEHSWVVQDFRLDHIDFNNFVVAATKRGWSLVDKTKEFADIPYEDIHHLDRELLRIMKKWDSFSSEVKLPIEGESVEVGIGLMEEITATKLAAINLGRRIAKCLEYGIHSEPNQAYRDAALSRVVAMGRKIQKTLDTLAGLMKYTTPGDSLEEDLALLKKKYPILHYLDVENGNPVVVLSNARLVMDVATGEIRFEGDHDSLKLYF